MRQVWSGRELYEMTWELLLPLSWVGEKRLFSTMDSRMIGMNQHISHLHLHTSPCFSFWLWDGKSNCKAGAVLMPVPYWRFVEPWSANHLYNRSAVFKQNKKGISPSCSSFARLLSVISDNKTVLQCLLSELPHDTCVISEVVFQCASK